MVLKKQLLNFLKFLLFLGIGVTILYLVYRSQNAAYQEECALRGIPAEDCSLLHKVWNDFRSVNYFWILMVFVVYALSNVSRAIRWNMLLRTLGYQPRFSNALLTTIVGYFANLGLPRMGEVVRAGMMARYEKMPVEKVIGTVFVDRVVDVISILFMTGLALLLDFDKILAFANEYVDLSGRLGGSGAVLGLLALIGVAALSLFYVFRKQLMQIALVKKIVAIFKGFGQGIQTIRKVKRPWLFILHSLNIWVMYFLMNYFCLLSFAPTADLPMLAALTTFVFGAWGIVIPSPGGMGTYHFLVQLALGFYGVSGDDGFSFANIAFFSIQLGCNVFWGILALLFLPNINRNYQPAPAV
jgi:hypothetical protein